MPGCTSETWLHPPTPLHWHRYTIDALGAPACSGECSSSLRTQHKGPMEAGHCMCAMALAVRTCLNNSGKLNFLPIDQSPHFYAQYCMQASRCIYFSAQGYSNRPMSKLAGEPCSALHASLHMPMFHLKCLENGSSC